MQSSPPSNIYSIVIPILVIGVVLFFRVRRMKVQRPLKLGTLWVVPAIFLVVSGLTLAQFPPHGLDWAWLALALLLGAALGWQRGRLMKIWVDPESGGLMTQGSGWALVFLVVLLVLRMALREGLVMEADAGAIDIGLINSAFVVFAFGLFGTQRGEMALRATRLTKAHLEAGETA
uniref:CcdC protein domain-containing protein n=1 Tax=Altererythrobacter segetis TaxID=1104773 RepID=UPI00140A66E7|nr:CcdC protein domain-containing protein [Altererythrobacter segetis]